MIRIRIEPKSLPQQWRGQMAGLGDRLRKALSASLNMAASMLEQVAKSDIAGAGNFGSKWTDSLHVNVDDGSLGNMRMYMTCDIPYASIFETGGTISGSPLLWIPLSGTDAAGIRASAFGGGLFSARYPRTTGRPLLFAMSDKAPRYFGVEEVTIPKKFHLTEDVVSVMSNFRAMFDDAWQRA